MLTRIRTASLLLGVMFSSRALVAEVQSPPPNSGESLVHVWQTDDGLPENWVSSIVQTPDGYLWVGTRYGGLARFDGVRFTSFNPRNTPELKDVQVEFLSVDATGTLWIFMGNESITSLRGNSFKLWRWPRAQPRLRASSVLHASENQLIFASERSPSLIQLDPQAGTNGWEVFSPTPAPLVNTRTFTAGRSGAVWYISQDRHLARFLDRQSIEIPESTNVPGQITAITGDAAGHLWLAAPDKIGGWNGTHFAECTPTNGPAPENILQIACGGDGGLWVYEPHRLRKCLGGRWVTEAISTPFEVGAPAGLPDFYGDAQGNVWVVSYGRGLWHSKPDGNLHKLTEREGLPSVFITCWIQDSEGDVWIGTAGGGIARIRDRVFNVLGPGQGLPGKVVRSVCEDSHDILWAGTMAGRLARFEQGKFTQLPLPPINREPVENITTCPAPDGGLWIGSTHYGLMQRRQTGEISQVITAQTQPAARILFEDSLGQLWVGGLADLSCFAKGKLKTLGTDDGFQNGIAIGAVAEDASGALWIGTGPGDLWKLDHGKFTQFTPKREWPSVRISALLTDTNGTVWVGTLGGGLLRFRDGQFVRYTMSDGLPDDNITQLLDDHENHLWAGTYAGIFRTSKTDLEAVGDHRGGPLPCRVFGRFDGLPALECTSGFQPSCWRTKDGRLLFATVNGVISVDPKMLTANEVPPRVVIEDMLVDGKKREFSASIDPVPTDRRTSPATKIEAGRHYFQFRYTGLNFIAPDEVRFRVRLLGAEPDWQDMVNQRLVGYGPLPPGDYQLQVTACNSDGVWNKNGASLAFTILPYFWQTLWFKFVMVLGGSGALGLSVAVILRRRHELEVEQLRRRHEIERERARIAQDLHDDLGTTLTQISMLSALANREQTPPAEAKALFQQVRARAREMVVAMDEIVWAVNPKNDSFVELVNYLGNFAEDFFRPTNIRCRLDIPDQLRNFPLTSESRHHLFLAFKEAVNNAARHSGASRVWIRAEVESDWIVIHIEDNGRGFDGKSGDHPMGDGIVNMSRRLEQIGGRAEVRSTPGKETVVLLYLPLSHTGKIS